MQSGSAIALHIAACAVVGAASAAMMRSLSRRPRRYSGFMLAAFTTGHHLSISAR
jgi:hypothetical protein